jgi:hypothetical protein
VQAVGAPYFRDRDDDLLKLLKDRLFQNSQSTDRNDPMFPMIGEMHDALGLDNLPRDVQRTGFWSITKKYLSLSF